jgi:hypothetical protein
MGLGSAVTAVAAPATNRPIPKAGGDFSGVWLLLGGGGIGSLTFERSPVTGGSIFKGFPDSQWSDKKLPFSPRGLELLKANKPNKGPRAVKNDADPIHGGNPWGLYRTLIYGRPFQFVQVPGMIIQLFAMNRVFRIIYTDGRQVPDDVEQGPFWYGYSVGHWEGDTLVATTLALDSRAYIDEWGTPIADGARVEERWRHFAHDKLGLQITVNDPEVYSNPWTSPQMIYYLQPGVEPNEMIYAPIDEGFFNNLILNGMDKPTNQ